MTPDEVMFRQHLTEVKYLSGVDDGRWGLYGGLESIVWPSVILWVKAHPKVARDGRVYLKFTLDGYPERAPTAVPWDIEQNTRLPFDRWPIGPGSVSKIFRRGDWEGGRALYAPCDRVGISSHPDWRNAHGQWCWTPSKTITMYLEFVHMHLNPVLYDEAADNNSLAPVAPLGA